LLFFGLYSFDFTHVIEGRQPERKVKAVTIGHSEWVHMEETPDRRCGADKRAFFQLID
jgi:hypothetical protein